MCSADVAPSTWARDPVDGIAREVMGGGMHSCRAFEVVRQWALARPLVGNHLDVETVVKNDPLGWGEFTSDGVRLHTPTPEVDATTAEGGEKTVQVGETNTTETPVV